MSHPWIILTLIPSWKKNSCEKMAWAINLQSQKRVMLIGRETGKNYKTCNVKQIFFKSGPAWARPDLWLFYSRPLPWPSFKPNLARVLSNTWQVVRTCKMIFEQDLAWWLAKKKQVQRLVRSSKIDQDGISIKNKQEWPRWSISQE